MLIKMSLNGKVEAVFTEELDLEYCLHCVRPSFTVFDSKFAFFSYETSVYFSDDDLAKYGYERKSSNSFPELTKLIKLDLKSPAERGVPLIYCVSI